MTSARLFRNCLAFAFVASVFGAFSSPTAFALSETIPAFELPAARPDPVDAGDCGYRNLYELPNDPLADIPIYEQGETDLCYAYTAAQLTEYYLRKNSFWPSDEHLNPLWIAIAYKGGHSKGIRIKKNELGHGFFHTAFKDMADLGVCDPRVFERELAAYKDKSVLTDPDFFFLYEQMWDQRARHENFLVRNRQEYDETMKKLMAREDFKRIATRAFSNVLSSPTATEASSASGSHEAHVLTAQMLFERELRRIHKLVKDVPENRIRKKEKIRYLRNRVFGACSGDALLKPDLPESKSIGIGWASNAKLKAGIDRMLDAAIAEPVGIGYCSRILADDPAAAAKGAKRGALLPRISKALRSSCSAHYSMVVGRRKAATGCQYLIRNTYGRDFWTKRYDCLCERADHKGFESCRYDAKTSPATDKVVGCWIDEKPLLNSLFDVAILRKKELAPDPIFVDPAYERGIDSGADSE